MSFNEVCAYSLTVYHVRAGMLFQVIRKYLGIYKIDHPWKAKPMYDGTCAATFFGLYLVEFSGAIRGILHSFTRP